MDSINIVCPVCTLYLRPGITLKQHLTLHPKQKVIEALVKLAGVDELPKAQSTTPGSTLPSLNPASSSQVNSTVVNPNPSWNQPTPVHLGTPAHMNPVHGNHLFIYQQSMSTTTPQSNVLHVNPMSPQQYVYHPAIFNPQMMPYVYQQQQVILSSNSLHPQIRALPFELPNSESTHTPEITNESVPSKSSSIEVEKDSNENDVILLEEREGEYEEPASLEALTKEKLESLHHEDDIKTMEDFENEQIQLNDIPPEDYHDNEEDCNGTEQIDQEELVESLHSENSEWKNESELSNKACQTQNANTRSPTPQVMENEQAENNQNDIGPVDHPEYFYLDPQNGNYTETFLDREDNIPVPYTTHKETEVYEQSEPIYTSANILHGNDHLDYVSLDDIVIISDFNSNPVASQVENFENSMQERPRVLMTIGEIPEHRVDYSEQRDFEESMSRSSSHVNIRSDERMPARGELSGQESIDGNSDITWNRLQYQEGSSHMSHSYGMIGRGSWEASDSESIDGSLKCQNSTLISSEHNEFDDNDMPTIVSCSGPPLNFRCSACGDAFASSKERKEHEITRHPEKSKNVLIGSEIGKKSVKKLIIKAKADKPKTEPNFDNIFSNKLKLENPVEETVEHALSENQVNDVGLELPEIKAICPICDCVLDSAKSLKQHRLEVHKDTSVVRHKCSTCGEFFPNEYKYTEHLKIHPLECRLCGKLFFRRQNIRLHMKRHLGLKPYKCEICEKSFVTRQKHNEHKNIHTGDAPIKCNLCDEKFRRHSNLVQHRNRHHFQIKKKIKDYICHCGEIFHSKKKLAWHKEIHDSKPKACSQCSEKFLHMSSLTRHMRRAHNEKFLPEENRQNENVECPICKGTYLRSSLEIHIKNHSGIRPYTCLMCNKDFTTKWNLKLHKWTHASRTSKPYKCDQCKGAFIRESDYIAHMNSHKSVRPYTCNYCGAQFIRKYNCLRHVKEHENDKTFSCNVCGKTFHRSYYLKDHLRVHSGIRPYTCHICGKTSTTKSNHNKHVQIHHAREPVSTEN